MSPPAITSQHGIRRSFQTTTWTWIVKAQGAGTSAERALEELCQAYWNPLYAFLRRTGVAEHDAEDAIQSFFAWLVESQLLVRADRDRGRFRCFLIAALKQFMARRRKYLAAAKRSPRRPVLSIERETSEQRYRHEPTDGLTPDRLFERAWALQTIDRALARLREEYEAAGRAERFDGLKGFLTGQKTISGREAAQRLGIAEGTVRVAVHRLKRRYGELLRDEVSRTIAAGENVDDELARLAASLEP